MDEDWLADTEEGEGGLQGGAADPLVGQQWERISTRYADAGYREGITSGKLSTLQEGFDQAFAASVGPSRRLGQLRGRATSLLAVLKSLGPEDRSPAVVSAEDALRDVMGALNRVKRTDALPSDHEAEEHAREEHGDEGEAGKTTAMTEDVQQKRDLESLESALEGMGGGGAAAAKGVHLREGALLDDCEARLRRVETLLYGG